MPKLFPPGTRERALELLSQGKEPWDVAKEIGASPSTVLRWQKEALEGKGAEGQGTESIGMEAKGAPPVQPSVGPELRELLGKHPGSPILGGTPAPLPQPATPPPKPMEPEALLALVSVIKSTVVQTASAAWKISLSDKEREALVDFSESEKTSLKILAPYAAEYTGTMGNYAKPVMACLFVGIVGFSTLTSIRALKSKLPPKAKPAPRHPPSKDADKHAPAK